MKAGRNSSKFVLLSRLSICLVLLVVSVLGRAEQSGAESASSVPSKRSESKGESVSETPQRVSLSRATVDHAVHNQSHHAIRHGQHRKIADGLQGDGLPQVDVYGMTLMTRSSRKAPYFGAGGRVIVSQQESVEVKLYGKFDPVGPLKFSFTKVPSLAAGGCNEQHTLPYVPILKESQHRGSAIITLPRHSEFPVGYICIRDENNKTVFLGTEPHLSIETSSPFLPFWASIMFIVFLLVLSGLFSGLNLGLMSLNKTDLKIIINTGTVEEKKCAAKIAPVRNHGNFLLCCLLFSNVLVNTTLTILLDDITSGAVAVVLSTLFIVTFGEIVPQAFCSRYGLKAGAKTIVITKLFMFLTFPLAYPMSKVLDRILGEEIGSVYTRERLKELLRVTKDHHGLENEEVGIISGALDMKSKTVRDVMTKLDRVFMLPSDAVLNFETMSEIEYHGYSRIPIFEKERHNIVALLNVKQLTLLDANDSIPLKNVIEFYQCPLFYVFENTRLDYMFRAFREGNRGHLAIVQKVNDDGPGDPFYETVGIVTMEDVLEALLQAEIMDESDVGRGHGHRHAEDRSGTPFSKKHRKFTTVEIPPTLLRAAVQFLSASVQPFKTHLTEGIIQRLVSSHVKFMKGAKLPRNGQMPTYTYLFEMGKAAQSFVMILEGRVQVVVGKEKMTFEGGPFTCFGTEFLAADHSYDVLKLLKPPAQSAPGTPEPQKLAEFVPDYSVKVLTDITYFQISYHVYQAAKVASEYERNSSDPKTAGSNWEAEFEKVLTVMEAE